MPIDPCYFIPVNTAPRSILLCGGKGQRFTQSVQNELDRPHLDVPTAVLHELLATPKVLLPIQGCPLAVVKLRRLIAEGCTDCTVILGEHADVVEQAFRAAQSEPATLVFKRPNERDSLLGIVFDELAQSPNGVLVSAGDSISTIDYGMLVNHNRNSFDQVNISAWHDSDPSRKNDWYFAGDAFFKPSTKPSKSELVADKAVGFMEQYKHYVEYQGTPVFCEALFNVNDLHTYHSLLLAISTGGLCIEGISDRKLTSGLEWNLHPNRPLNPSP